MNEEFENSQKFDSMVTDLQRELLSSGDQTDAVDKVVAHILAQTRDLPQHMGAQSTQPSRWLSLKTRVLGWFATLSLNAKALNGKFTKIYVAMFVCVALITSSAPFFTSDRVSKRPMPPAELTNALDIDLTFEEWWLAEDELLFLDAS